MNLSLKLYGWKCVLGAEVVYILCLLGGFVPLRSSQATELHHRLFETLEGLFLICVHERARAPCFTGLSAFRRAG